MDIEKFIAVKYDGSIDSYNKMVDDLGIDSTSPVCFMDENFRSTWKFTGNVYFFETGIIYKPGDYYQIPVIDCEKCNGTGTLDTPETLLLDIRINAPTEHWGVSACDECKGYGNIKKC